jgi:glyoxylase I family protein
MASLARQSTDDNDAVVPPLECRMHSIAIQTATFDAAYDFYTRILGFPVVREPFRYKTRTLAWIDAGTALIELYTLKRGVSPVARDDAAVGIDQVAFVVSDLENVISRMTAHQVKITKGPFVPPSGDPEQPRVLFVEGPDGTPIQFRESRPAVL